MKSLLLWNTDWTLSYRDVKFVTPENEPEKYDIYDDYTIHSPTKATDFDKKIDILIKNTNLTVPPNR